MTYEDIENSGYDGSPVELFRFAHGSEIWRYSSGSEEVEHDSETYSPVAIGREGEINVSSEPNKSDLSIILPLDLEVSQLFLTGTPESIVSLTIFRLHKPAGEFEIYWKGRVVSFVWKDDQARAVCEPIFTSIKQIGLRARYTRACRHALYSTSCGVDKALYAVACTVTDVSGLNITFTVDDLTEYQDDYFMAGMLYASGAWRFVLVHAGGVVSLMESIDLSVDDEIILYPGCDHVLATCISKFDNVLNNGGCPWIPTQNPFDGSLV